MWQPGETTGFSASQHVEALYNHCSVPFLDHVVINTEPIPKAVLKSYASQHSFAVENDVDRMEEMGIQVVGAPLVGEGSKKIRHDSDAAAAIAMKLAERSRRIATWKRKGTRQRPGSSVRFLNL